MRKVVFAALGAAALIPAAIAPQQGFAAEEGISAVHSNPAVCTFTADGGNPASADPLSAAADFEFDISCNTFFQLDVATTGSGANITGPTSGGGSSGALELINPAAPAGFTGTIMSTVTVTTTVGTDFILGSSGQAVPDLTTVNVNVGLISPAPSGLFAGAYAGNVTLTFTPAGIV